MKSVAWIALLAAGASSAASAAWQYTTWSMNPDAVVLASNGAARLDGGRPGQQISGYELAATGTYRSGEHSFVTAFYFRQGRLQLIDLELVGNACSQLESDMKGVYGEPEDGTRSAVATALTWRDRSGNNLVNYLKIGSECSLRYRPLVTANGAGL